MKDTKIEWAHHTFNPWIGCTKVSPACDNCYAEKSMPAKFQGVTWGAGQPRKRTSEANWRQPIRWNAEAERLGVRYRVFCASLADVFDKDVPAQWRIDLMKLICETPHLDWLLLTKRIGNASEMLETAFRAVHHQREGWVDNTLPNVWIGATICNQQEADRDIPKLLEVPAAKRFLSIEPLLGPMDISKFLNSVWCEDCDWSGSN
jgi:protein gp37